MINFYKRKIGDRQIRSLPSFEIGCWISVIDPSPDEVDFLCKKFKLDKRNLLSGLDEYEIPRLDFINEDIYIFTKTILPERKLQTFLIVIGRNFILTLSKKEPTFFEKIFSGKIQIYTTQKLKTLIKLLFLINERFEKETTKVVKEVRASEIQRKEITEQQLEELLEKEDFLNNLVSSYYYLSLLYERMIKRIDFFEQDREMIRDLIEEINEGFDLCKSSLKTISNIRDHLTIILTNKLNKVITILTIFTILISLPAAISGIYGMNIALPLQKNPFAFHYIMGIIIFTWVSFIFYLRKNKII